MSSTPDDPGPALNRDRIRDLDQLRLSSTDRYIAGVAGGLGRHFGIDPIVIRVVLAALCIFSGVGWMIYLAFWLFVPSEVTGRAIIDLNAATRRTVLLLFVGIGILGVIGSVTSGFNWIGGTFIWPLAALVGACSIALAYLRPEHYRATATTPPTPPTPTPPTPTWTAPAVQPRPRRTGLLLFWPTVAAILVASGILGIIAVDHTVAPLWWPGTALAIVGAALVVGAFAGRPGGLIPLGIVLVPGVLASAIVGTHGWHHQDLSLSPTAAAAIANTYDIGAGQARIDLSHITDPTSLAGRTITVDMTAGQIKVTVPPGVQTRVDADLAIAGDIRVADTERSGFEPSLHTTTGSGSAAPLHLILKGRVGSIQVNTP